MRLQPFDLAVTTTSTPYSSGDVVGVGTTGLQITIGTGLGYGVLKNLCVVDASNQSAALTFLFFKSQPTGPYTDNGAFAWGVGDKALVNPPLLVPAADYSTVNGVALANHEFSSGVSWPVPVDGKVPILWLVIVTTGTPTYGANSTSLRICGSLVIES